MANKALRSYRLTDATLRQLSWLASNGWNNATAVIATAVDRMYREERSTMTRMSYEAEPEEIDEVVLARAQAVHAEECGCDNKRCNLTNEIYQWLMEGDKGEGSTAEQILRDWREYTDFA